MKLLVLGANGKVGQMVVAEALRREHSVRAFVHSHSPLPPHPDLEIVTGDVHNETDVQNAARGCDAIVSTLGSWHTKQKDIVTSAVRSLVPIMEASGPKRIVTVTGAGALLPTDRPNVFDRLQHTLIALIQPKILRDGEEHMRLLAASSLDWTAVRSPIMNNHGSTDYTLRAAFPMPWQTINRGAVAKALVDLAESGNYIGQAPVIAR